jgi:charged multivesicular body protein 2A
MWNAGAVADKAVQVYREVLRNAQPAAKDLSEVAGRSAPTHSLVRQSLTQYDLQKTYRTNEQMMQAMKGATMALGSMNRSMNLRENDIMEQRQEMMDDVMDDAMDVGAEEEGEEVIEQVLEEIGVDLSQTVRICFFPQASAGWRANILQLGEAPSGIQSTAVAEGKTAVALGSGGGGGGGGDPADDDLQARLDSLRR